MESRAVKIATKLGLLIARVVVVFILPGVAFLAQMKTMASG
jgi:hypothetical protein